MNLHIRCIAVLILSCGASALIVPEELVSLLSVIYSNIPPIRKGTDSRLGVGFRLGNNADVQFIVELGPQINTQPLGPQRNTGASGTTSFKRHVASGVEVTEGNDWLSKWRANIERRNTAEAVGLPVSAQTSNETPKHENIDIANRIINEPMILHLQKLYRGDADGDRNANNGTDSNAVGSLKKIQTLKGLDDVHLGDK